MNRSPKKALGRSRTEAGPGRVRGTRSGNAWAVLAVAIASTGCGPGDVVKEVRIPVRRQAGAIERCREYLQGYARGEPVGSEVIGFTQLADEATKEDPELGGRIARGLREIEASLKQPQTVAAKAKEILAALPPAPANPGN